MEDAAAITGFDRWDSVEEQLMRAEKAGARAIGWTDEHYPALLRQIHDPPPLLWVRGNESLLHAPALGVIGTRRPDRYGVREARRWAQALSEAGLLVVSGLAYGIDAEVHRAASAGMGKSAAVLPCGIDRPSPAGNRPLVEKILADGGVVLSEFPPGSKAYPAAFPVRNRVISGLSLGVLVIQSGKTGGSMITARLALDQNREVFVIPHSLSSTIGSGNHELIRTGQGLLVVRPKDIFEEIRFEPKIEHTGDPAGGDLSGVKPLNSSFSTVSALVLRLLGEGCQGLDQLSRRGGLSIAELLPALLKLEVEGRIQRSPGNRYELSEQNDFPEM